MGEKQGSKTEYAVLRKNEDGLYEYLGVVEATSSDKAKAHFAEKEEVEGTYVAPPSRSFQPTELKLERTPRARIAARVSA